MADLSERAQIDFIILADRVEVLNGKLYMMGGAWDQLGVADFGRPVPINFAIGVLIPWSDTNVQHPVRVWIEHEDGTQFGELNTAVNMGRPPHAIPGQSFRAILAVNGEWRLPKPGTYRLLASVGSSDPKRAVFHVRPAPTNVQPPPNLPGQNRE